MQTYKECGEEAIQPIIQQLNAAARHHDVEMRDRGLKILQALLEADPTPTPTPTLTLNLICRRCSRRTPPCRPRSTTWGPPPSCSRRARVP